MRPRESRAADGSDRAGPGVPPAAFAHMFDLCDRVGAEVVDLDAAVMGRAVYRRASSVRTAR